MSLLLQRSEVEGVEQIRPDWVDVRNGLHWAQSSVWECKHSRRLGGSEGSRAVAGL
jgi:hypothetical protein